jgi:hypothetical protein
VLADVVVQIPALIFIDGDEHRHKFVVIAGYLNVGTVWDKREGESTKQRFKRALTGKSISNSDLRRCLN